MVETVYFHTVRVTAVACPSSSGSIGRAALAMTPQRRLISTVVRVQRQLRFGEVLVLYRFSWYWRRCEKRSDGNMNERVKLLLSTKPTVVRLEGSGVLRLLAASCDTVPYTSVRCCCSNTGATSSGITGLWRDDAAVPGTRSGTYKNVERQHQTTGIQNFTYTWRLYRTTAAIVRLPLPPAAAAVRRMPHVDILYYGLFSVPASRKRLVDLLPGCFFLFLLQSPEVSFFLFRGIVSICTGMGLKTRLGERRWDRPRSQTRARTKEIQGRSSILL